MKPLNQRLEETKEKTISKDRWSSDSNEELAEAYHHQNWEKVAYMFWNLMSESGEEINDYPPSREVEGKLSVLDTLEDNQRVVVDVSLGDRTQTRSVDADGSTVEFRNVQDGTHSLSATATELRTYDPDSLEYTSKEITSFDVSMDADVTVDTTTSDYGTTVTISTIEISNLEVA